ncbi:MAG TPA: hypothetical protein VHP11_02385 [Tepidisphaeraceae bacterium]|nr:hypothetical protein [Tepidisphaeraceae bacterium]
MKALCSSRLVLAVTLCMLASCGAGTDTSRDVQATRIGKIENDHIKESSGIIASRQYPGVYWTLNDHGNSPVIYAMTREGKSLADFRVPGDNRAGDWEDISTDDQGHLYIASIGNNEGKRKQIEVIRIKEPNPTKEKDQKHRSVHAKEMQVWQLTYPDGIFDAESLYVYQGYGYIISKVRHNMAATMYRFPLTEQSQPGVLEKVTDLRVFTPVTAASISPDGKYLAVLCWGGVHVFKVNGDIASAARVEPADIPLVRLQFEGCSFTADGIIVTAESREIFFIPAAAYQ